VITLAPMGAAPPTCALRCLPNPLALGNHPRTQTLRRSGALVPLAHQLVVGADHVDLGLGVSDQRVGVITREEQGPLLVSPTSEAIVFPAPCLVPLQ
jgi:hypothetical protein